MVKPLHFHPQAFAEGRAAWEWYAAQSKNAANRFQDELIRAITIIQEEPRRWPEYILGTRVYQLRRFPYLVIYRENNSSLEILAIAHGHRKEGYWKRRLS